MKLHKFGPPTALSAILFLTFGCRDALAYAIRLEQVVTYAVVPAIGAGIILISSLWWYSGRSKVKKRLNLDNVVFLLCLVLGVPLMFSGELWWAIFFDSRAYKNLVINIGPEPEMNSVATPVPATAKDSRTTVTPPPANGTNGTVQPGGDATVIQGVNTAT